MPRTPEPVGPPEDMAFLRWVKETLESLTGERRRQEQANGNVNDNQNSTMTVIAERLGKVQETIQSLIATATFAASQVTSGIFDQARIPNTPVEKVYGNTLSVANVWGSAAVGSGGSLSANGDLSVGGRATIAGDVYVPNSTIASFGSWTVAYIDGDGRLTRGASSRRFKKNIVDAPELGNVFAAQLRQFEMNRGDGQEVLGYIAEELVDTDMERFIVWSDPVKMGLIGPKVPLSIDWIPLILAQNVALNKEVQELKADREATNVRLASIESMLSQASEEN